MLSRPAPRLRAQVRLFRPSDGDSSAEVYVRSELDRLGAELRYRMGVAGEGRPESNHPRSLCGGGGSSSSCFAGPPALRGLCEPQP